PVRTGTFRGQLTDLLEVRGDISSQYISALMMTAPVLPQGLRLRLTGKIGSRPYIDMTRAVMKRFGVHTEWLGENVISIPHQSYRNSDYTIERDWSAASYWYSIMAIRGEGEIFLKDLIDDSIQGDRIIADLMEPLGVQTKFTDQGAMLTSKTSEASITIDFSNCPDLAQTIAVVCAVKGIRCTMLGLESLRIKETDRIAALQQELKKLGTVLRETSKNMKWEIEPGEIPAGEITIDTYHDHRMAMSFAPVAWLRPVVIRDPEVVNKSYPGFWKDLDHAGAAITLISD
ncbi:MAG: 3-phosphoshikimate 1-carboxyvinyltransferase, partial [Cyclobacteriaceae bacterium]